MADSPADLLVAATAQNAENDATRAESDGPILSELHGSGNIRSAATVYEISTGQGTFL
ncbi:hypothetical protein [Oceaniovalibus sp. ACAM 378]|uniref:hypothetical protein n=1 Tax=Oceaniovalibus sp. ACAM 378 TaxID=2599923 RepID=UPI0016525116|nr:hypothetical protein [Oceaniovalibus sp. ACAM 378]